MQSDSSIQPGSDSPALRKAFHKRMLQNAILHRVEQGLDPLHACRFQDLGVPLNITPPGIPRTIVEILQNPEHADRIPMPEGPLLFLREGNQPVVLEPVGLLLHPELEIRRSAAHYLKAGVSSSEPWLTPNTAEALEIRAADCESEDVARWHAAGIELVPLLHEDLFAHLAALRQSLAGKYEEGLRQHLVGVMRPRFRTLANLAPPVRSATEQRDDIRGWIREFAALSTLHLALTNYVNRCGYVPLLGKYGAAEVARQWMGEHPGFVVTWDDLWSWAVGMGSPLAKYHAITVALSIPSTRPVDAMEQFWKEVLDVLDVGERVEETQTPSHFWRLYCDLAAHFARHIESLHPGQDGERVACYAWWLADKVGRVLGKSDESAKRALATIVGPAGAFSSMQWAVARSPVVPSAFRYATLYTNSVWAMSLTMQLSETADSPILEEMPAELRARISETVTGLLLTSPIGDQIEADEPVFAFQQTSRISELYRADGLVAVEQREMLNELMPLRQRMATVPELQSRLERLPELPAHEQRLTVLHLREAVYSSYKCDDAVAGWLTQINEVAGNLQRAPETMLDTVLEALTEFHQHRQAEWATRLPQMLAYAVEHCDNADRVKLLHIHAVLMSINAGIVSPIQRIAASKWRAELRTPLAAWRENMVAVGKQSEPWVAARVRATSACISRLIGPRVPESPPLNPNFSVPQ